MKASLGDKAAAAAKSSPEWRSWSLEGKAAAAAKSSPEWRSWRETSLGDKAAAEAKSSPEGRSWRATSLGDKAAGAAKPRVEIMKGDKWRETRQQRQPRAAQNGDHEGRQMKGDKAAAAAKSSPERRSGRETNEGRQGGSGITTIWRLWGSATQSLRSKNPNSFQLSGEKLETLHLSHIFSSLQQAKNKSSMLLITLAAVDLDIDLCLWMCVFNHSTTLDKCGRIPYDRRKRGSSESRDTIGFSSTSQLPRNQTHHVVMVPYGCGTKTIRPGTTNW